MKQVMRTLGAAIAVSAATLTVAGAARSAEYYDGKRVTLWIGGGAAGGVNAYGRLFARHVVNHLPGKPTIVAKNLPGAGGIGAVTTLYKRAKKDGTAFGTFALGPVTDPLLNKKRKYAFDMMKFNWIGALNNNVQVCHVRTDSPIKTIQDVQDNEVTMAATGARSGSAKIPLSVNAALSTRFKVVIGYRGTGGTALAFEKGEVMGRCTSYSSLKALRQHWFDQKLVHILVQVGAKKHADLPNVPWALDLAKSKDVVRFVAAPLAMAQPIALPPGVPAERVKEWRAAFAATVADPAFLAEAKKLKMEVDPKDGDAVLSVVKGIYATPPAAIALAAKAFKTRTTRCDPNVSKKCRKARKKKNK